MWSFLSRRQLEEPWGVLAGTGNGIGRAPGSLRAIPDLDEDAFDELYNDELADSFWHQGTIYAATPFALEEVLKVLPRAKATYQERLLRFAQLCLGAERLGPMPPSHAGLWLPLGARVWLKIHGVERPAIETVLRRNLSTLQALADQALADQAETRVRESARGLLASLR